MRKFGLIGGTSWHSTARYYSLINGLVNEHFGDNTSPPLLVLNLNHAEIHALQQADRWSELAAIYTAAARDLERAGAKAIAFCANTPHKLYDDVQGTIAPPILHIGDAIGEELARTGIKSAGLLGTAFTMEEPFLRERLERKFEITTVVPAVADREEIQRCVYEEFCRGIFSDSRKAFFLELIESLRREGADAAVLGCTEFSLLLEGAEASLPVVDSLSTHSGAIARFITS